MARLLFSPIGGTDPISENNLRDGSMLHICRVYKPDKVILYISKEMLEKHHKDNRYIYCLERLAELQNREMSYELVERPDLEKVYEFDYFYKDFKEIIDNIITKEPESELLINISSGTPAMKSGLAVLQTLSEYPCKLIQVTTPARGMNEHTHTEDDFNELWELNYDNTEDFENRCLEIECPTLSEIKKEEMIKRHLSAYDYSAALDVAKTLSTERRKAYYNFLVMANYRYLLNLKKADEMKNRVPKDVFPTIKTAKERELFEYALQIQVKLFRGEYADFIRGITPLIVDLFEVILKESFGIDINDYTTVTKKERKWDLSKLANTEVLRILNESYREGLRQGPVYSDALCHLIRRKCNDGEPLRKLAKNIRDTESSIRNMAAHTIVSIDDKKIKEETGFTAKEIMGIIQDLFKYTKINLSKKAWDAYDIMNEFIIGLI